MLEKNMPHPLISTHHLEDTKSLGFLAIIQSRSTNRCPTLLDTVTSVTSVTLIHVVGSGLDSSFPFSSGPCRYPNDPKWKCLAMQGHLGHISNQIQLPTFHLYLGCKRNGWVVSSISSWDRPHHFYILSSWKHRQTIDTFQVFVLATHWFAINQTWPSNAR